MSTWTDLPPEKAVESNIRLHNIDRRFYMVLSQSYEDADAFPITSLVRLALE